LPLACPKVAPLLRDDLFTDGESVVVTQPGHGLKVRIGNDYLQAS
jgi:hypothetical protein